MKKTFCRLSVPFIFAILFIFITGCNNQKDSQLQQLCGKQCEEYFKKEHGDGVFDDQEHSGAISYKYHYNNKMNKCFIILHENGYKRSDDKLYKMKSLADMNEKKKFGYFYNIGTSTVCDVLEKKCTSEKEWDELVRNYMEE